jgi:hypothetical protein
MSAILPIPESIERDELIPVINERLRRIEQAIAAADGGGGGGGDTTTIVVTRPSTFQLEYL